MGFDLGLDPADWPSLRSTGCSAPYATTFASAIVAPSITAIRDAITNHPTVRRKAPQGRSHEHPNA
jgi:hypothetical protein